MSPTGDLAFVLGNGPSLRSVDLERFSPHVTVGMNAAYRYWERIGWYPTHYCCLDEELLATHHDAIRSLIVEGLVESAFLTAGILDFQPELAEDERCVFFDSFSKGWHDRRGKKWGLPYSEHPAFRTAAPSKVTTGAYAARYAIYLGHRRLFLIGVDCNYVEVVEGAQAAGGFALRMVKTPDRNPNYFFDDYQQAGDRYNLPNPEVHGGNLHLQSFEALRDDVAAQGLPVEIVNCSKASKLASEGAFPYRELDYALGERLLGAVAVPMTFREEAALVANLRLWDQPGHLPRRRDGGGYPVPLVLVLNGARDGGFENRIRRVFDRCDRLSEAFSGLEFEYCALSEAEDVYERGSGGNRSGPNNQFLKGAKLLSRYGRYVFMMETDCLPIRPGWLAELERIVQGSEPFWILGSLYRGVSTIGERWRGHINGNAVYAVGDPRFQSFIDEVWRPALETLGREVPGLSYDCVPEFYFGEGRVAPEGEKWRQLQEVAHMFRYTEFIQNHAGKGETERGEGASLSEIRDRSPHTYVVHGRHLFNDLEAPAPPAPARKAEPKVEQPPPTAVPSPSGNGSRAAEQPLALVIDQDALDWSGHWMSYNDKLSAALTECGLTVKVICNRELAPDILQERPHFVPALCVHSWTVGFTFPPPEDALTAAQAELETAIDGCLEGGRRGLLYIYTGSIEHADIVARILADRPHVQAEVNLFWLAANRDQHSETRLAHYRQTVRRLAGIPRLRLTVPTRGMQRVLTDGTGVVFDVAPHPSTAIVDRDFPLAAENAELEGGLASATPSPARYRVLFPGAPRDDKGFRLTLETARRLAEHERLDPVIRYSPRPNDARPEHEAAVEDLPSGVTVVRGVLDNNAFLRLFRESHVSVLAYDPAWFGKRTSGLVIDSVYHGLPVITTRGTWLGDFVTRFECGAAVEEASAERLVEALEEVTANYAEFAEKARSAAWAYFERNSWAALAESIAESGEPTRSIAESGGPVRRRKLEGAPGERDVASDLARALEAFESSQRDAHERLEAQIGQLAKRSGRAPAVTASNGGQRERAPAPSTGRAERQPFRIQPSRVQPGQAPVKQPAPPTPAESKPSAAKPSAAKPPAAKPPAAKPPAQPKRRTSSDFEAIAIHQMGKVGSRSLVKAVTDLKRWPCFHTHVLNPAKNKAIDPSSPPSIPPGHSEIPAHIGEAREVRSQFIDQGRPVGVITAIREPIARNASAFFQNLDAFSKLADYEFDREDPDQLYDVFRRYYPHHQPQRWIERELNEVFGVDALAEPFPEAGWVEIDAAPHRILIVKTSLEDDGKARALRTFLGVDDLTVARVNVTKAKAEWSERETLLDQFLSRVGRDEQYLDRMLELPMAGHFFSDDERSAIRTHWLTVGRPELAAAREGGRRRRRSSASASPTTAEGGLGLRCGRRSPDGQGWVEGSAESG